MRIKAEKIAFIGVMGALILVLSAADSVISAALPVAGVRIGLSNVVIICVMLWYGLGWGAFLAVLRTAAAFLTRGFSAGMMSVSGGTLSLAAVFILLCVFKRSYKFSAVIAAVCHTVGQLITACFITGSFFTLYYAPVLIPAAVATGMLTGTVIEIIVKRFGKDMLYRKD